MRILGALYKLALLDVNANPLNILQTQSIYVASPLSSAQIRPTRCEPFKSSLQSPTSTMRNPFELG